MVVLRLRPQDHVQVLDNQGAVFEVVLVELNPKQTLGNVVQTALAEGEPKTKITLFLGLTQREKFEWILQKATEIGAAAFVPLITRRSLVQTAKEVDNKVERWQRIIKEAAEQAAKEARRAG